MRFCSSTTCSSVYLAVGVIDNEDTHQHGDECDHGRPPGSSFSARAATGSTAISGWNTVGRSRSECDIERKGQDQLH